jgi:cellulose synthase/poly-beta-1,6-N-acetylglucosamine synthase-like glycosyltransferase
MDWLARHGCDRRFPMLLLGGAGITGFLSALLVLIAGTRNPADLAMAGAFLGIGPLLRVVCPAVLLWLMADVLVRRTRFNRRWIATFTAWVIAVTGCTIMPILAAWLYRPARSPDQASRDYNF